MSKHYYCFQFPKLAVHESVIHHEIAELERMGIDEVYYNGVWYYGKCEANTALVAALALDVTFIDFIDIDDYV